MCASRGTAVIIGASSGIGLAAIVAANVDTRLTK